MENHLARARSALYILCYHQLKNHSHLDSMPEIPSASSLLSRRSFVRHSGIAAGAASVAFPHIVSAQGNKSPLKLGLIGCGGRGRGAANQALTADKDVTLTSVADVFERQADGAINNLRKRHPEQVGMPDRLIGLDAYKKVIEGSDVVILTTPPGFRPMMLREAIEAGKHVFCEKPVAVDAPGVRSVLESAKMAKEKKLTLVCGFCWRYQNARRALFEKIHDGAIGDVTSMFATYYTGPVKPMPSADRRPEGTSDVAWQVQNWYNFGWLSGDSLAEQAVHSVDKIGWATGDIDPISAVATGGRQIPAQGGNIYDHFHVVYEYPNNVRCHLGSRQQTGCHGENHDYINGTAGTALIKRGQCVIQGKENWRAGGDLNNDMYQTEHDEMYASIRNGDAKNDGEWMAHSTMLAILGRMAAYTGQQIKWEDALNSKEDLAPDDLGWDDDFDPGGLALPGKTKFI